MLSDDMKKIGSCFEKPKKLLSAVNLSADGTLVEYPSSRIGDADHELPRCVEALARAGQYDKPLLAKAIRMFEDFLQYTNHVGLCTEEISPAGDGYVQPFSSTSSARAHATLSQARERRPGLHVRLSVFCRLVLLTHALAGMSP